MPKEFSSLTITELREKCKKKGIKGYSSLCKKDLVKKLKKHKVSKKKSKKSMKGGLEATSFELMNDNTILKVNYANGGYVLIGIGQQILLDDEKVYTVNAFNVDENGKFKCMIYDINGESGELYQSGDLWDNIVILAPLLVEQIQQELISETGNSGNGTVNSGNGTVNSGNGTVNSGNGTVNSGNRTVNSGNRTVNSGNGTVNSGNGTVNRVNRVNGTVNSGNRVNRGNNRGNSGNGSVNGTKL
jgi:hypothetical protein